jgi:hypothetical protein
VQSWTRVRFPPPPLFGSGSWFQCRIRTESFCTESSTLCPALGNNLERIAEVGDIEVGVDIRRRLDRRMSSEQLGFIEGE